MTSQELSPEALALGYLDQLPFVPYPFQEEAILSWFESEQGVLVCAPTGMGKTLIAEAGLYEALQKGRRAYYTTPLIALTEQKFREIQETVERWGFDRYDVGLITGNRRENPDAKILVVVAEILFNRLLSSNVFKKETITTEPIPVPKSWEIIESTEAENQSFSFDDVAVVVMDEFHYFTDQERGIVWEFTLGLLPAHVKTLLISATVGNAYEFISWLRTTAKRTLSKVESQERKVPLTFSWVEDKLLPDFLEEIHVGDDEARFVPALVFCFNRDECWDVAEVIKGKNIIDAARQKVLAAELDQYDWTQGAGPKLRQLLIRGIGVHHAGILSKYRRIVENLFQQKLLSLCICTETLAAGINLPARSVVVPSLMKGAFGDKKLIESSTAHQIFGRAGRPQFDTQGFVFALAHEDDVRIAKFREKYDQIPEDTKDPKLREAKKKLKKKMPTRNIEDQYWSEQQFIKLRHSSPGKLTSRGDLPWRLLAHMIEESQDLHAVRTLVAHRLMGVKRLAIMQKSLDQMLLTLWRGGFIRLEPDPVDYGIPATAAAQIQEKIAEKAQQDVKKKNQPFGAGLFDDSILDDLDFDDPFDPDSFAKKEKEVNAEQALLNSTEDKTPLMYKAEKALPTEMISILTHLRGVNPVYGAFLMTQLGIADRTERLQAFESLLEMPNTVLRHVRVPDQNELPPGPLQLHLNDILISRGLATAEELVPKTEEQRQEEWEKNRRFGGYAEERVFVLHLAEKLKRLFDDEFPRVAMKVVATWAAGEILLVFKGDFNKFIISRQLQKQEGIIFRHLLRLILLLEEFRNLIPVNTTKQEWQNDLDELSQMLAECCRKVDPTSTEETLTAAKKQDGLKKT